MFRRFFAAGLFTFFLFTLLSRSCDAAQPAAPCKILCSFYPIYVMALNVTDGVGGLTVENLAPPFTGCLHDYALTVSDMKKIVRADLLVMNGSGMESYFERITRQYPKLRTVTLTDGAENPHVWVSVEGSIRMVERLGKAFETYDPEHAELYRKNTDAYVAKLKKLGARMHRELDGFRLKPIVTFHEAFPYFAEEFGFKVAAVIEREPGSNPSAAELAKTVRIVKQSNVRVLFAEPQYSSGAAETIAQETGATVYFLDPAVTGPSDKDAYLRIMEKNLETLKRAFAET